VNITVNSEERYRSYQLQGRPASLALDGALDHDVWDRVSAGVPLETREQFVKTLHDPRLSARGEQASAAGFGLGWKDLDANPASKEFVLGDPQGPHQIVQLKTAGRSGNEFTVTTSVPGVLQHQMSGRLGLDGLNSDYIKEQIILLP
jgi:hypothetical protein